MNISSKKERVKNFLDASYEILKDGNEKNMKKVLEELKKEKLSTEYITALRLSKIVNKEKGKLVWSQKKPTIKMSELIIKLAQNIIEKRNVVYKAKRSENIFKFMRTVYKKISRVPKSLDDLNYFQIITDNDLTPEYGEALLIKKMVVPYNIFTGGKEIRGYRWEGPKPTVQDAERIHNFVLNRLQKAKKLSDRTNTFNKKFISDYVDFVNHIRKSNNA